MLWKLLAAALLTFGLTFAVACGDDDDDAGDDSAATTAPAGGDETAAASTAPAGGEETDAPDDGGDVGPLALQAADFAFAPANLAAPAGATVSLTVTNVGEAAHTFTVDALDIDEEIAAGEQATIEFTIPDEATEFYCKFHKSQMTGMLTPD
jgi:plastocyanin